MEVRVEVSAREAVQDIRSGFTDLELMDKYRLTDRGLASLFRKLVSAGLIRQRELEDRDPTFISTIPIELQKIKKPPADRSRGRGPKR